MLSKLSPISIKSHASSEVVFGKNQNKRISTNAGVSSTAKVSTVNEFQHIKRIKTPRSTKTPSFTTLIRTTQKKFPELSLSTIKSMLV